MIQYSYFLIYLNSIKSLDTFKIVNFHAEIYPKHHELMFFLEIKSNLSQNYLFGIES
jgi:hypothetical protein